MSASRAPCPQANPPRACQSLPSWKALIRFHLIDHRAAQARHRADLREPQNADSLIDCRYDGTHRLRSLLQGTRHSNGRHVCRGCPRVQRRGVLKRSRTSVSTARSRDIQSKPSARHQPTRRPRKRFLRGNLPMSASPQSISANGRSVVPDRASTKSPECREVVHSPMARSLLSSRVFSVQSRRKLSRYSWRESLSVMSYGR